MNQIQSFIADMEQRFENNLAEVETRLTARMDRFEAKFTSIDESLEMLGGNVGALAPVVIRFDSRIKKLEDKA